MASENVRAFLTFFFKIQKHDFLRFESLHTFSRRLIAPPQFEVLGRSSRQPICP